jgi:hypothetical protein
MAVKAIDHAGKRFGRWTVLSRAEGKPAKWLCRCDCGVEKVTQVANVISGRSKSCGCLHKENLRQRYFVDITGQRFGLLIAQSHNGTVSPTHGAVWLCKCDCGQETCVRGNYLRSGHTRSCGCLHTLPKGEAAFNRLYDNYKRSARRRGLEWGLNMRLFRHVTKQPCYYCGHPPSQKYAHRGHNGDYTYSGVDRIDNSLGYLPHNVVACCPSCNTSKGSRSTDEFIRWVAALHNNMALTGRMKHHAAFAAIA